MESFSQYAVAAAKEAMEMSGIDMGQEDPYRVGICVGSGVGSLQAIEREYEKLLNKGPARVNPLLVPLMITNMAAGNIAIQMGIKGKSINIAQPAQPGTHNIGEAFRGDPVWRVRCDAGRRHGKRHHTHQCGRFHGADSPVHLQ